MSDKKIVVEGFESSDEFAAALAAWEAKNAGVVNPFDAEREAAKKARNRANSLLAKNLGRSFSTWDTGQTQMPPDGTMVPRIKGGRVGTRALIKLDMERDYFQREDRDAPFRTTDLITGLPVIIRRAACGLGCRCDATVEVDMTAYREWRRITLGRFIPRCLGVTNGEASTAISQEAERLESRYITDGRLHSWAKDEATIAGILREAQAKLGLTAAACKDRKAHNLNGCDCRKSS